MNTPDHAAGPARRRARAARCGTPPPLAAGFTPRPETAPDLAARLAPGAAVVLVRAQPATSQPEDPPEPCGKTQLAAWYAESVWRSGQVDLLDWVDASSRASALSGYAQAAQVCGLGAAGTAEQAAARFTGWLAETTQPWLLVLDDLRDLADLDSMWPAGPAGMVLVTAPDQDVVGGEPARSRTQVLPVGAFSSREALAYLMGRLADDPDQRHGAIDLAHLLGRDPGALAHAAALITTTTQTCQDYRHRYTTDRAILMGRQPDSTPPPPAAVTWILSAGRAAQLARAGATGLLLALAALLDSPAIPAPIFTAAATRVYLADNGAPSDLDQAAAAVRALEHAGLLTIDTAARPPLAWISRTVAARARAAIPDPLTEPAASAAADALLETWPDSEPPHGPAAIWRSCAAGLQRTAGDRLWTADACHPLLVRAGRSLDAGRLTGPAVGHWTSLTATSERLLGSDHPVTLAAAGDLARALLAAGQHADAVSWSQWVAARHARRSGPDHPATLTARVQLGRALAAAGQSADAIIVLERVLASCDRARGRSHPDTLAARDELAAACRAAGQHAEAIAHYQHILVARERQQGPRDPATLAARDALAAACLAGGQARQATTCYRKNLANHQRLHGPNHSATIAACRRLAAACQAAGDIAAALRLHDQAATACQRALGADHRETLASRADLAEAYRAAGRLADAAAVLRETLTRCEHALPSGHPLTRAVRQNLTRIADA